MSRDDITAILAWLDEQGRLLDEIRAHAARTNGTGGAPLNVNTASLIVHRIGAL